MKKFPLFSVVLLCVGILFVQVSPAQDYTRRNLPEGALARLGKGPIHTLAHSSDGTRLAVASSIGIWIYDAHTGAEIALLTGHTDWIRSVSFSPDGRTLVSGSWDRTIRLWDVATGTLKDTLAVDYIDNLAFSPDGTTLAGGGSDKVHLWDVAADTLKNTYTLPGHSWGVYSLAFSPDGTTLASGDNGTIRLWDVATGTLKDTLTGHEGVATGEGINSFVYSVAFSPDGTTLASGGADETVRLWDVATGTSIATLKVTEPGINWVWSVAFSPDGTTLASSGWDQSSLHLWDIPTGTPIATFKVGVGSLAFSPDGEILASGSRDGTIHLWDVVSGAPIRTLEEHTSYVNSVSFSPDGKILVSGSGSPYDDDNTVRLWDVDTGQEIAILRGHKHVVNSVAFSPDGKILASGSGDWGTARGGDDRTVRLWDVDTGQEIATLRGHKHVVSSVAFSPDGKILASGSGDTTILLWDMSPYVTLQSPDPDFDGDGTVGFPDFLLFVAQFGSNQGDAGYDARYDLDGDGTIGFGDFLIFANAFGKAGSSN